MASIDDYLKAKVNQFTSSFSKRPLVGGLVGQGVNYVRQQAPRVVQQVQQVPQNINNQMNWSARQQGFQNSGQLVQNLPRLVLGNSPQQFTNYVQNVSNKAYKPIIGKTASNIISDTVGGVGRNLLRGPAGLTQNKSNWEKAGDILATGGAALAPLETLGFGVFNAGVNKLTGSDPRKGYQQGIDQGATFAGVGKWLKTEPMVNSLGKYTFAKTGSNLASAASRVGMKGLVGGLEFGGIATTGKAKTPQERWENFKSNFVTGAAFNVIAGGLGEAFKGRFSRAIANGDYETAQKILNKTPNGSKKAALQGALNKAISEDLNTQNLQEAQNIITKPTRGSKSLANNEGSFFVDVRDKATGTKKTYGPYSSNRIAEDAMMKIPLNENEIGILRAEGPSNVQVLEKRIKELRAGGFSTKNAEKALAQEKAILVNRPNIQSAESSFTIPETKPVKKLGPKNNKQVAEQVTLPVSDKSMKPSLLETPNTLPEMTAGTMRTKGKQLSDSYPTSSSNTSIPKKPTGNPIQDDITGVNPTGIARRIQEAVQDSWIRVKQLQRQKGSKVDVGGNPYLAEELFHGRVGTRLENIRDTIIKTDQDLLKTSKSINVPDAQLKKDVNQYLQALHAPERNAVHGNGAAGMTTEEANKILIGLKNSKHGKEIERLANSIKDINKQTLDVLLDGQVIDKKTYDMLTTVYKNHVPLNRVMNETDDIADILVNKGFNVKSTGIKRAKGSDKEVADIFTNVVANVQAAIVRAEKNRVNLATLRFARNNPQLGLFEEIRPRAIGSTFDGKIMTKQIQDPLVLTIRENGKPVYLKIKDERLAKVFQGVGEERLPSVFNFINTFTRFYSGLHTRFNPEFALSNVVRDSQEMAVYMASQKGIGAKGAFKTVSEIPISQKAILDSLRGIDSPGARLYKQMQLDGGTTGGMALSTRANIELDMAKIAKINRSNPRKAVEMLLGGFDKWNTIFEDGTRLSVYKRALESGVSREQAASMAKNATVNFNKKGSAGPIINSLYMFANASIQGSAKMLRAMKNPKVAAAVSTMVAGPVWAVNNWNDSVDPNWRSKVTEWDRNSNLVVMIPSESGAKYFTIPVSWGLKPLKVVADTSYDLATGHENKIGDAAVKIATSAFDAYNPVGGQDIMSAATPTILDTPSEIARNKAWHGGLVRPDWLGGLPKSEQHFKGIEDSLSGEIAKGVTQTLSEKTNRFIDISPDDLLYAYNAYIGGVGKFATRLTNTVGGAVTGQMPPVKDIPFINRFYKTREEEQVQKAVEGKSKADFIGSLKQYKTGSPEQRNAIRDYLLTLPDQDSRAGFLYRLYGEGIPTKGISPVESKIQQQKIIDSQGSNESNTITESNPLGNIRSSAPQNTMSLIQQSEQNRKKMADAIDVYKDSTIPDAKKDAVWKYLGTNRSEVEFKALDSVNNADKATILYKILQERQWKTEKVNTFIDKDIMTASVADKMAEQGLITQDQATQLKTYIKQRNVSTGKKAPGKPKKVKALKLKKVPLAKFKKFKAPKLASKQIKYAKIKKPKKYRIDLKSLAVKV